MAPSLHSERAHAQWSASASARNFACPGALALIGSLGIEDREGEAAAWGTACHQVAEKALRAGNDAADYIGTTEKTKAHSFVIDDEMAECTQVFIDYVRGRLELYADQFHEQVKATLLVEQHFDLAPINPPLQAGGTGDAVLLFPAWGMIEIVDLKTGKGYVDAEENRQLRTYALGAMLANRGPWTKVRSTIVQPRSHGDAVRCETLDVTDLFDWTVDLLDAMQRSAAAISDTFRSDTHPDDWTGTHLNPGDHCRDTFCPAAAHCPALEARAMKLMRVHFKDETITSPPDPADIPIEKLAAILDAADMIEGWLNGVRQRARELTEAGIQIGEQGRHYILVAKQARRKWIVEPPELGGEIMKRFKITTDRLFEQKVKSPAQVTALVKEAMGVTEEKAKALIADLCPAESSGTNLVRADKTNRTALPPPAQRFFQPEED